MRFVKASTDGDNPFSRSPNCYYSPFYEAVSFVGETIQLAAAAPDRKTILTCNIARYCTASTDTSCFVSVSFVLLGIFVNTYEPRHEISNNVAF